MSRNHVAGAVRSRPFVGALVALLVAMVLPLVTGPGSAHAATEATIPITTFRAMTVAPDGRVFVAGDDRVVVYDDGGTMLDIIPDVWGAADMDVREGSLWVTETTAGAIARIDLATLEVVETISLGVTIRPGGIAVLPDAIWFVRAVGYVDYRPYRYDRVTGVVTAATGPSSPIARLTRLVGDDSAVIAWAGSGGASVQRISTASPYAVVASIFPSNMRSLAVDPASNRLWVTTGSTSSAIVEHNLTTLATTGVTYPNSQTGSAIAHVPGAPGRLALASSPLSVFEVGNVVPSHQFAVTSSDVAAVAFAPDASRLHTILSTWTSTPTHRLVTNPLAAQLTSVSPTTVVRGVSTKVTVSGTGLGGAVSATLGAVPVTVLSSTSTTIELTVSTALPPGTHTLAVTTANGTVSRSLLVVEDVGATLDGVIRSGTTPAPGIEVTLTGSALPSARVVTTSLAGAYQFTALPYGTDYQVAVHDPSGTNPDFVVGPLTLVPNGTFPLTLDLRRPPAATPTLSRFPLPSGTIRDLFVDPSTGHVWISVGNEIFVFDAGGGLLARRLGMAGAGQFTKGPDGVYVALDGADAIIRFDPTTFATTGTWQLGPGLLISGGIAYVGGRVWFSAAPTSTSSSTLRNLDPATGSVATFTTVFTAYRLDPVEGDPTLLLGMGQGGSATVFDIASGTPAVAGTPNVSGPLAADATRSLIWSKDGVELRLGGFAQTGFQYPAIYSSGANYSPARGGLLSFGISVSRVGSPVASHQFGGISTSARTEFDLNGDRLYVVSSSNELLVQDLDPYITSMPSTIYAEPQTLLVTGSGLGLVSGAALDGAPLAAVGRSGTTADVVIPSLTPGQHTLTVTTPWGTSVAYVFTASARPPAPPTVAAVSPTTVPLGGGEVTITGSGFTGATAVKVGSTSFSTVTVVDDSTITAVAPARSGASGEIKVTTPGGTNATGPTFAWVAPVPVVSGVSPASGPLSGGYPITITGTGLQFATSVKVGTKVASGVTVVSDTEIRATVPSGTAGAVPVTVTTAGGTSAEVPAATFTYLATHPSLSSASPSSGPVTGGTLVTIRGSFFVGVQRVRFGSTEAVYSVVDSNTIVAVAPPGALGTVNLTVTTADGTTPTVTSARFAYTTQTPGTVRGWTRSTAGAAPGMVVVLSGPDRLDVIRTVTSGPDGSFEMSAVAPGQYRILTLDPGIFSGATQYLVGEFYDDGGTTLADFATSTPVTVTSGGLLVLNPIVLDHNTPGTVSGVVRDTVGHGLPGMEVFVSPVGSFDASVSALTGADGTFSVPGLAPGAYRVVTMDPAEAGGATAHYVAEVYDNAGGLGNYGSSTIVNVAAGGTVSLAPIVLNHTAPGSLTGTVVGSGGAPLANMVIMVSNADGFVFAGANVTAANGSYSIGNLPPGEYKLAAFDARVLFGVPALYRQTYYLDAVTFETATRVVVSPGAATPLSPIVAPLVSP